MNLKIYILFLISLITCTVFGQEPALSVKVSKNKLGVNQRLRVEYTINKQGGDNFKEPNFKNFKVIGGPSQAVSQSISRSGGKTVVVFSQTYSYVIKPKKVGTYTLPLASVDIDGKTIKSNEVKVGLCRI